MPFRYLSPILLAISITSCARADGGDRAAAETAKPALQSAKETDANQPGNAQPTAPKITTGNGQQNNITLEGATRKGATFTFPRVQIDKNGWLVMHPFKGGKPVPNIYVGHTAIKAGVSENVDISVGAAPPSGTMFIVMLHYDVNDDGIFDFNDGITVPDAPVFEDGKLIALRYAAPEDSAAD